MALPPLSLGGDQAASSVQGGTINNGSASFPFGSPNNMQPLLVGAGLLALYLLLFRGK